MKVAMTLEMAASAGDRAVVTAEGRSLTAGELLARAHSAAARFRNHPAVLNPGTNDLARPIALFGAALAGAPFIPVNDGLGAHQPHALVDAPTAAAAEPTAADVEDQDAVAVILDTSGTTTEPEAAPLRSSKTPDTLVFRSELPKTETGKLLRRTLLAELETTHA